MDQREPRGELRRALADLRGQTIRNRLRWSSPGPEPPVIAIRGSAEQRLGIAPQHGGECAFIARRGAHRVERLGQAMLGPGLPRAGFAVTAERLMLALDPGQFGLRRSESSAAVIAGDLQFGFPRLLRCQGRARSAERCSGLIARCFGGGQRGQWITLAGQCRAQVSVPLRFAIDPRQTQLSGGQLGLGDAPFGFDPGLIGGRLGQGQFGVAQGPVSIVEAGGDQWPALFIGDQRRFACGQFAFEPGERFGSVAGQAVSLAAIFLEPLVLAFKVGEALLSRFKLVGQRGHPVAVRAGIVAPVGQFLARLGQRLRGSVLGLLRRLHRGLCSGDARFCAHRLAACRLSRRRRIAPAREHQPRLGQLDLVRQRLVALRRAGLTAQRSDLLIELALQVFQPGQIGLGRAQLLLGVLAADVQPGDPGGLFQHHPALGRLGGDHCGDPPLADQRW